ncbi:MAG: tRNA modification GTPase MnmE [Saprospiraceae bacterium]|jgi:tRNA modification GTPase|nr:tRNA modification GTPase MnmE [Saprospiraceae bacterium]
MSMEHYGSFVDAGRTIAAVSTPPGVGALAVIRLSGRNAIDIVARSFRGRSLHHVPSRSVSFGRVEALQGQILDEVVVTVFREPHSYTGEDVVEVSCHGSPYIINSLLSLYIGEGAQPAGPGEFTMRAFLHGKMDLSQAEAVADLIAAETQAAHRLAMQQLRGGIRDAIGELRSELLHFLSLIELELDFSEEDVEFADREALDALLVRICLHIDQLLSGFQLGNAVRRGIQTVIAGKPNVGKSTLLNALLGEERALVSELPGTTRDTVEDQLNIGGILFHFVDTAGIRETSDQIEQMGVARTREKIRLADILLYVLDGSICPASEAIGELSALSRGVGKTIAIANKVDLSGGQPDPGMVVSLPDDVEWLACSARSGQGLESLRQRLYEIAAGSAEAASMPYAINARHLHALDASKQALLQAQQLLQSQASTDLVAQSIRHAAFALGSITGAIHTEEVLGNIFSSFCIGK